MFKISSDVNRRGVAAADDGRVVDFGETAGKQCAFRRVVGRACAVDVSHFVDERARDRPETPHESEFTDRDFLAADLIGKTVGRFVRAIADPDRVVVENVVELASAGKLLESVIARFAAVDVAFDDSDGFIQHLLLFVEFGVVGEPFCIAVFDRTGMSRAGSIYFHLTLTPFKKFRYRFD